ncbi:MAG: DUF4111 domain-containing protein [Desulfobacteraceae bacterium]|nr:DUF4111 domain-containing protein [Desulfobacteraceae bacterium]
MRIPDEIRGLCEAFLDGLNTALGRKLYGVYLYGALAFPEGGATGDVDFHVILNDALNGSEKLALENLHATLAQDYPPLGAELDGYYILLEEARQTIPPRHQLLYDVVDNSWALHRAHIRAGRCIILQGPDPSQVYPEASWSELESALQGELDYVGKHLAEYPAYCVLNLCRLMYSFETRDVVVSKVGSARWAYEAFPDWGPHIEAARKSYVGSAMSEEIELIKLEVRDFFDFACEHIRESRGKP